MSFFFGKAAPPPPPSSPPSSEFITDAEAESAAAFAPSTPATSQQQPSSPSASSRRSPETVSSMIAPAIPSRPSLSDEALLAQLHPLPAEDRGIQYLFINDNPMIPASQRVIARGSFGPLPMRTNYDKLLYGTGVAYVLGLAGGGAYGAMRGLRISAGMNSKLRMNSLMNGMTRYGPWAANSMGILTMLWALTDNLQYTYRKKSDAFGHISSAFVSGLIFKSTAGLRPALISGGLMAGIVTAYEGARYFRGSKESIRLEVPSLGNQPMVA
ncbi:hypothetical protein DFJ73DRAFT_823018 [Zopfochytrium polystomum]|nr:hypothetical protein DFJ73DRAFT_823018 [Zopfochytrium polystomum]